MKKLLILLCAVTLVLGMVGTASAIPFKYKDVHKHKHVKVKENQTVYWTHNIAIPETQDLTSARIKFKFFGNIYKPGKLAIGENVFIWEGKDRTAIITIILSDTGFVKAKLKAIGGIIKFKWAKYLVEAKDISPAPVPEPATILLMGSGILGLVAYGRKRRKKV